jgi:uncharacterized membrane protein YraQ (UPF0718 family)
MRSRLGDHRPRAVVRASWYGMASSSFSYAASAMAKSLLAGGADFTSAMIFMISSTNLVIELGIVMLVLLGWQFAVAEFVGGPVMIVLLALIGTSAFSEVIVNRARILAMSPSHEVSDDMTPSPERSDLIAMPLTLIYHKFYGGALTLRLVGGFYAAMVVAGLATEVLFRLAGLAPTNRVVHVGVQRISWNYTT